MSILASTNNEYQITIGGIEMEVHKIDYGQRVYQGTLDAVRQVIIATMLVIDSYNGETIGEPWISDRDEYAAGATPSTGAQVAYTLDEPLEIPVSVSNTPIKSLSGYNHIESTTGEMEVEYITQPEQPIIDLINSAVELPPVTSSDNGKVLTVVNGSWDKALAPHIYSTTEQVIGKWIDGNDLYEKMLKTAATAPERFKEIEYLIKSVSADGVIPEGFEELYNTFRKVVKM